MKEFENIATITKPNEILFLNVDVLCPCGPAYVINKNSIPKLKCKIIAGGANCQLEDEITDDEHLYKVGILIAPDYVLNAGGVIHGIAELNNENLKDAIKKLPIITENLINIYKKSKQESKGTYTIAKKMALNKIEDIKSI